MNALPPRDQLAAGKKPKDDHDHVHLTMSFEDDETAGVAPPGEADQEPWGGGPDAAGPEAGAPPEAGGARRGERAEGGTGRAAPGQSAGRGARGGLPPQFAGIELCLTVEVGSLNIALKDLMAVEPGQLLALDRMTSEPVTVLVNGKPFARGEIVAVGDRYGVRLLEIVPVAGEPG